MKTSFVSLILLSMIALPAFAQMNNINVDASNNPDGTVTIRSPRLLRGNKAFPFGSKNNPLGICKSMGFDSFLSQTNFSVTDRTMVRAYVDTAGKFLQAIDNEYDSISEITCYNGAYKTSTKFTQMSENPDLSTTIINPRLVRGNKSYPFGSRNNMDGICRAMGFREALAGTVSLVSDRTMVRAYVNESGDYTQIIDNEYDSVSEISCVKERTLTVVKDQNGNKYFRAVNN